MPRDLNERIARLQETSGLPGLGAAVVDDQGLRAIGVVGRRRADVEGDVRREDAFHLGSETKAMTAFLVGRLVEQDVIEWDTSLGEVFADSATWMHEAYRGVTITQLLRHRGGVPSDLSAFKELDATVQLSAVGDQRQVLARGLMTQGPLHTPGSTYFYSNMGYIVAGAVLEHLTHKPWEALMRDEVFTPLGMGSCGFGPTAEADEPDGVWAHELDGSRYRPTDIDNPPYFGPAGTVHCSLEDWGKFAAAQFDRGPRAIVSAATLERLHAGVPIEGREDAYALGWTIVEGKMPGDRLLTHDGSNMVNYASVFVAPEQRIAVLVVCNAGGTIAQQTVVQLATELLTSERGKQAE